MSHIDAGGDPHSVEAGRELADVSASSMVRHGAYLVVVCVAVWLAMAGMFKLFMGRLNDRDAQVSSLARPAGDFRRAIVSTAPWRPVRSGLVALHPSADRRPAGFLT